MKFIIMQEVNNKRKITREIFIIQKDDNDFSKK